MKISARACGGFAGLAESCQFDTGSVVGSAVHASNQRMHATSRA